VPSAVAAAPSAAAAPSTVVVPESPPQPGLARTSWPVPTGPLFEIIPGKGLGPIRLGATVATIERLMELPCEIKTETLCRYLGRGADFVLKDGAAVEMRVYRRDRPTTPAGAYFGVFNGRMRNGVDFEELPFAVKEIMGAPKKVETVSDGGPAHTVEVHSYDGLRIEYDRLPNGNNVVGAFVIVPP
jgi:hypothetical protein